eukprot:147199-Amorphochlora_amoeboformis.AAC.1
MALTRDVPRMSQMLGECPVTQDDILSIRGFCGIPGLESNSSKPHESPNTTNDVAVELTQASHPSLYYLLAENSA